MAKKILVCCCTVLVLFSTLVLPTYAATSEYSYSPVRSYDNLLPSVQELIDDGRTGAGDKWFIWRNAASGFNVDNKGNPLFDESTEWCYWLYFVSDDVYFNWVSTGGFYGDMYPAFNVEGSVIHQYRLSSTDFDGYYVTDAVLSVSPNNSKWSYYEVTNSGSWLQTIGSRDRTWSAADLNFSNFSWQFVASSFDIVSEAGSFTYYPTDDITVAASYDMPSLFFSKVSYIATNGEDASGGSGSGSDGSGSDGSSGEEVTWLQKIWNSITDGFDQVMGKLQEIIDAISGKSDIDPDLKEDTDNAANNAGNLQDGVSGVVGDFDSGSSSNDFFNSFGDGSSTYDFFNGTDGQEGFFFQVSGFFTFLNGFWSCLPFPIAAFIIFAFATLMLMAVFKMFF